MVLQPRDPSIPDSQCLIKLNCGKISETSPEFLHHPEDPDIISILFTVSNFRRDLE